MIITGIVALLAGVAIYFERQRLKTDAIAAKAKLSVYVSLVESRLKSKESQVRAKIAGDVAKIVADVKAWAEKEATTASVDSYKFSKDIVAQFEARLKQIL